MDETPTTQMKEHCDARTFGSRVTVDADQEEMIGTQLAVQMNGVGMNRNPAMLVSPLV